MEHGRDVLESGRHARRVVEGEGARLEAVLGRDGLQLQRVAAGEDDVDAAARGFARDELPGVARRAVDQDAAARSRPKRFDVSCP